MGKIYKPNPVKLIIGCIFKDEDILQSAKSALTRRFGACDLESPSLDFSYTAYYAPEMGTGLKRVFLSFKRLIQPKDLAAIKVITNRIETKLSKNSKRQINLDPGYIDMAKLVLASTKDYNHRIYLDKGIFAEITLRYQDKGKSFTHWDWTYPDYRSAEYIEIFNQIRELYRQT